MKLQSKLLNQEIWEASGTVNMFMCQEDAVSRKGMETLASTIPIILPCASLPFGSS